MYLSFCFIIFDLNKKRLKFKYMSAVRGDRLFKPFGWVGGRKFFK